MKKRLQGDLRVLHNPKSENKTYGYLWKEGLNKEKGVKGLRLIISTVQGVEAQVINFYKKMKKSFV